MIFVPIHTFPHWSILIRFKVLWVGKHYTAFRVKPDSLSDKKNELTRRCSPAFAHRCRGSATRTTTWRPASSPRRRTIASPPPSRTRTCGSWGSGTHALRTPGHIAATCPGGRPRPGRCGWPSQVRQSPEDFRPRGQSLFSWDAHGWWARKHIATHIYMEANNLFFSLFRCSKVSSSCLINAHDMSSTISVNQQSCLYYGGDDGKEKLVWCPAILQVKAAEELLGCRPSLPQYIYICMCVCVYLCV